MSALKRFLLSLLSALLLSLPWWGGGGMWLLGAFVPLMLVSHSYSASGRDFWRMYGWVALSMLLWSSSTVWWVWKAAPAGTIASVIIEMVLFGGSIMLYHFISKRAKQSLAYMVFICGWMAAEYLYLEGEISFPWLNLGNAFARETWLAQWYSLTGAFGGSLWMLLSNVFCFETLIKPRRSMLFVEAAWVVVPIVASVIIYFTYPKSEGETVKVTVVQPNFEPYNEKFDLSRDTLNQIMANLVMEAPDDVDYIVLPETAIGDHRENIWENMIHGSESVRQFSTLMTTRYPSAQLIIGASTLKLYPDQQSATETARQSGSMWYDAYNTALAIDSTGNIGIHHKIKLVIGTEKMPYMNLLKPLTKLIVNLGGTTGRLGQDKYVKTFTLDNSRHYRPVVAGAPICYEAIYGQHTTEFVKRGAQVLFVISNDGWWGDTPGYRWLMDYSRLRAIETRRAIGRSANTGISGFITPRGDKTQTLGWDVRDTLTEELPLNNRITFYTRHGDYLARIACYLLGLSVLYFIAYRIRRKDHFEN